MQATLTSKGQITLPVALRRKLRLKAGDVLKFDENSFRKALTKAEVKRMRSTLGRGKVAMRGKSIEQWMEWLRGPVELP